LRKSADSQYRLIDRNHHVLRVFSTPVASVVGEATGRKP
jgi:hypothetical protein